MRVVVADSSDFVRRMLRRAFERTHDIELVADTSCGQTALDFVERLSPDTVVTEVELSTISGIELTRLVRSAHPAVHVVGYTSHGGSADEMTAAGADVVLMKGDARSLIEALEGLR